MKASYANMKLKLNNTVKTFDFCGQKVEVLQYLPIEDKYDLIMITLQQAENEGFYNDFKLDLFFELNLVYMYTNISFTEKQKEDQSKIYDNLKSNGFFDLFYENFNQKEYDELFTHLIKIKKSNESKSKSVTYLLNKLITDLPANAEAAAKIVENFDPDKFQAVKDFAIAANGGRDIITNLPVNKK